MLLDEHLDRRLRPLFGSAHEVATVAERGWSGMKDRDLLRIAQSEFDAFVTMDRGIAHQLDIRKISLGIVLLRAPSNRRADTAPVIPQVLDALRSLLPGSLIDVRA